MRMRRWSNGTLTIACAIAALTTHGFAEQPAVRRVERDGLRLELQRLETDQTRAFLIARGFSRADADHAAATACMFRTAIGNAHGEAGQPELAIALADWRVLPAGGEPRAPLTREHWDREWESRNVSEEAAVAFHWALFPMEQAFAPSDHNWGFLSFGLKGGSRFALELVWRSGGNAHRARIDDLECAP
jgi:hypothetical protein